MRTHVDASRPAVAQPWKTWFGTFTGPRYEGCQDAAVAVDGGGWAVLAVSDGAGSAAKAADGSKLAMSLVQKYVQQRPPVNPGGEPGPARPPSVWLRKLVQSVGRDWTSQLERAGGVEDFYATLGVVLITELSIEIASIGDSFVLGLGCTGKVELLLPPDRPNGPSSSATYMLPDWHDQARYLTVLDSEPCAVLLSTDGLESFLEARVIRRQGIMNPTFIGVKPWLVNAVEQLAEKGDPTAATVFGRADVLARKGDDIGVALALRASA